MKPLSSTISACRRCRYYAPEGRRGGHCQQLNVVVQGAWKACALATPPFSPAWESFEDIIIWQQKTLAAMQASAELAMTDALSEMANATEPIMMPHASEPTPHDMTHNHEAQSSPVPVQTVGIKALWQ